VLLGIFGSFVLPSSLAHAELPPGITCSTVDGIYVCTDSSIGPTGSTCVVDNVKGTQTCLTGGTTTTGELRNLGRGLGTVTSLPAQSGGTGWLSRITGWFAYAIHTVFAAVVQVLKDLVTYVLSVVLSVFASAVASIPVPTWLSQYSMGSLLGSAGPIAGYFMTMLQIPAGLGLVGAGYTFRLLRKFLTLFQW
jgi:hypothetical protein